MKHVPDEPGRWLNLTTDLTLDCAACGKLREHPRRLPAPHQLTRPGHDWKISVQLTVQATDARFARSRLTTTNNHSERSITNDAIVRRSEVLVSTSLGDDVVMMDIDNGAYYGLARVAARIWELLAEPISVRSICETLVNEYDVEPDCCQREVVAFLDSLRQNAIVEIGGRA